MESLPNLELEDLRRKNKALEKRIKFLESFLVQKFEVTKKNYEDLKPYFEGQKNMVMQLFFEDHLQRLTYEEVLEKFRARHPQVSIVHLPRRLKEMVQEQRLVSCFDQERGRVVFHLKLFPLDDKVNGESVKNSEEDNKNLGEEERGGS
jgi:hypothetical protein